MTANVAREKRTCERTNLLLLEISLSEHEVFPDVPRRSRSEQAERGRSPLLAAVPVESSASFAVVARFNEEIPWNKFIMLLNGAHHDSWSWRRFDNLPALTRKH